MSRLEAATETALILGIDQGSKLMNDHAQAPIRSVRATAASSMAKPAVRSLAGVSALASMCVALLMASSLANASAPPTHVYVICAPLGNFSAECEVTYQSSTPVQIRWTWGGFPATTWNDSKWAFGGCAVYGPPTQVTAVVSNAYGSASSGIEITQCHGGSPR